jgi:hypothetical protein
MAFKRSRTILIIRHILLLIALIAAPACACSQACAAGHSLITAQPFTEERRLDLNTADEYDFMDIYEFDMLAAERAVKFKNAGGPFSKEEDLLNFIPQDAFLDIFETVEVGSLKSRNANNFNGSGFSDYFYDINNKKSLSSYSRYNVNFGDTMDLRFSFGQTEGENHLYVREKFLNYYYYTDSYLKKGYVIESSPSKKIIKAKVETDEELRRKNIEYLDGYFSQKVMIGRKKRKKINGLFETNLDSYKKHLLVKRKKGPSAEEQQEDEAEKEAPQAAPVSSEAGEDKSELVKAVKLNLPSYGPGDSKNAGDENARGAEDDGVKRDKILSMVLTLGDVMFAEGRHPLISLHRRNNSGVKIKKYFNNFDWSAIGSKLADKNEHRIGSALNFHLNDDTLVGGRVEKIWDNNYNHNIDFVHFYGMGRVDNTSVYGELQNVFNGAESIFAEVMSGFRDLSLTTRILSVKENYKEPLAVAPYSFDGQFSTFLRLNYNISGRASFASSYNVSDLKINNPDEDYGTQKIIKHRFLLYPNAKSRIMFTYIDEHTPLNIFNSTFATSLRYVYKPKIYLIGKFAIKDNDLDAPAGRSSESSVEWQRRVNNNLKVMIKYINLWDEQKLNTPDEFVNVIKLAYYRSF